MPVSKHEEKMVNLQVQLRQNQSELQDYLADLNNWETDIKKKEEQLKTTNQEKQPQPGDLPPVRNTIHKKKLKKKKKEKVTDPNKPKKISGFDFRAWDKFDVDKALEEIDKDDEKKETSSSEYETDEEWEMERKQHLAGMEKDKGNELLKKGDIDLAIEAYTKGMEFDSTNPILPANRAMAFLKQQKFAAAELDCTLSISLDPLYVKAYLRRATARSGMGKLNEAVADFNRVLDLEPSNKQAKSEIERLQKELNRDKETPVATSLTEDERGRVKPVYKPPEERSKKPLFRVPIEEIGLETISRPAPSPGQSDLAKQIVEKEKKEFDKLFSDPGSHAMTNGSDTATSSQTLPEKKSPRPTQENKTLEADRVSANPKTTHALPESKDIQSGKESINKQSKMGDNKFDMSKETKKSSESPATQSNGQAEEVAAFSVPQTSFQFQSDYKTLKNKPEPFFQYLQAIPPSSFPKLFGQSLDADILVTILKTLQGYSDRANVYEILMGLAEVKRFSMAAMFLSPKDKTAARNLMDGLQKSGSCSDQDLAALKKKYDL